MAAPRTRTAAIPPEIIDAIKAHFGSVRRAYDSLDMDDTVSRREFYRVMQGEPCTPAVAADVAFAWSGRMASPERLRAAVGAFARKLGGNPSEQEVADAMRFWLAKRDRG